MNKIFFLNTFFSTLIGVSIAGSLTGLPLEANKNNLLEQSTNSELIVSQINYSDRRSFNEPSDTVKNIVGLTGLAIGFGIVGYHVSKAHKPALANSFPTFNQGGNTNSNRKTIMARINPKLRRELLRLVSDRQTANRLLNGTSNSHPGRSANWIAEKVIYDLKRDR